MSEHPDYTQFRRKMFAGIGLPVNWHKSHDWRDAIIGDWCGRTVYFMQTREEIEAVPGLMEYPIEETIFNVPNWAWCPNWTWRFIPSHLELWFHLRQDVLKEQWKMRDYHRKRHDEAVREYQRKCDERKAAQHEQRINQKS